MDNSDKMGMRNLVGELKRAREVQQQGRTKVAARCTQLTATLQNGVRVPFEQWFRQWVAENIDGNKKTR